MSQFHLIIIGILMAIALVAVLMLGGVIPGFGIIGPKEKAAPLMMWGPIPDEYLRELISDLNSKNQNLFVLSYIEKDPRTYESELINVLASGKGPDIWLLSQDLILKHKDKIFPVPFASFSERTFKDIFIEEGELFLSKKDGIIALPFIVDPMVLYWNRDLFSSAGLANPPRFWEEFADFVQKLTIRDASGNILQAGASLGEFKNVDHFEDILSFLILQAGNPIVDSSRLESVFNERGKAPLSPAESALRFFSEFSDPMKTLYSWNQSLPSSKNAFVGGILALYFGYASEYSDIKTKNPHLNFDVSEVPQIKDSRLKATYGKMQGLAISKSSAYIGRAMTAAVKLIEKNSIAQISKNLFLAPVRRDLLQEAPDDPVFAIFYKANIQSRGWLKPDPEVISSMFKIMIEDVVTGRKRISEAVSDFHLKLDAMLREIKEKEEKP